MGPVAAPAAEEGSPLDSLLTSVGAGGPNSSDASAHVAQSCRPLRRRIEGSHGDADGGSLDRRTTKGALVASGQTKTGKKREERKRRSEQPDVQGPPEEVNGAADKKISLEKRLKVTLLRTTRQKEKELWL